MKKDRGSRIGGGGGGGDSNEDPECAAPVLGGGGDHYVRVVEKDDDDDRRDGWERRRASDLRLSVVRHLLFVGWYPRRPRYDEARPDHFPPQLDVLLTGGLYAHLYKDAVAEYVVHSNRVRIVIFFALLLAFMIYYWDTPVLFDTNENTGIKTLRQASYWIHALGLYGIGNILSYLCTRPAARRFHRQAEAVVRSLSPVFRRAGYDVEYCSSYWNDPHESTTPPCGMIGSLFSNCFRCVLSVLDDEAFVRFVPRGVGAPEMSGQEDAEEAADALWDPASTHVTRHVHFRVAVYGRPAYPGSGNAEPNFFALQSLQDVQDKVDLFTWGAVATEMRRPTELYQHVRFALIMGVVVVSQLPMWLPDSIYDRWWPFVGLMGLMLMGFVILCSPTGLEHWILVHMLHRNVVGDLRSSLQSLSPIVEQRSGYALWLEVEPDGCLGGTAAYVRFEPTPDTSATLA